MTVQELALTESRSLRSAHLYVIEFDSGTVKVGQTRNPASRFAEHTRNAAVHGHAVTRSWTSTLHSNFRDTELALIAFCSARWGVVAREYFPGSDYEEIVRHAANLPFREALPNEDAGPGSDRAFRSAVLDRFEESARRCADPSGPEIPEGHRRLIEAGFADPQAAAPTQDGGL